MLGLAQYNYSRQNLIYYELLEISLLELERKKYIKCIFLDTPTKEIHHSILIDKSATIAKLLELVLEKMNIGPEKTGLYRAYEVVQSRKTRDLGLNDLLTSCNDYSTITIEVMLLLNLADARDRVESY
jgi:ubiquitin carboxyl-terminal hydrolase 7